MTAKAFNNRKVVVIAGDSWTAEQAMTQLNHINGYHWDLTVGNRLRQRGYYVYNLAHGGGSMIQQLQRIEDFFIYNKPYSYAVAAVITGWTDFMRDVELSPHIVKGLAQQTFHDARAAYWQHYVTQLNRSVDLAPAHTQWLHWGGHSPISLPLPEPHRVLYTDYVSAVLDHCPPRENGLEHNSFDYKSPHDSIAKYFPHTSHKQLKQLSKTCMTFRKWRVRSGAAFPDGGHLDFKYYDTLIDTITTALESKTE